jgi:hypothetical protein
MSLAVYERMIQAAKAVVKATGSTHLVSGGAAWADHVAVALVASGTVPAENLTLHLPAAMTQTGYDEATRDGGIANFYHRLFRQTAGIHGLAEIRAVISAGAIVQVNPGGFKARNSDVAHDSTALLAFTFGTGEPWRAIVHKNVDPRTAGLKDGGTADTWAKCQAQTKIHVSLAPI